MTGLIKGRGEAYGQEKVCKRGDKDDRSPLSLVDVEKMYAPMHIHTYIHTYIQTVRQSDRQS